MGKVKLNSANALKSKAEECRIKESETKEKIFAHAKLLPLSDTTQAKKVIQSILLMITKMVP